MDGALQSWAAVLKVDQADFCAVLQSLAACLTLPLKALQAARTAVLIWALVPMVYACFKEAALMP